MMVGWIVGRKQQLTQLLFLHKAEIFFSFNFSSKNMLRLQSCLLLTLPNLFLYVYIPLIMYLIN